MKKRRGIWIIILIILIGLGGSWLWPESYRIERFTLEQPLDHNQTDSETFTQYVDILIPKSASLDSTVLFVLGGEGSAADERLVRLYKSYGERDDVIFIHAEHRGYGKSLSLDEYQTVPAYVTVDQALADFHTVAQALKQTYTGVWTAAGYSYSGGLVIDYAAHYPNDVVAILSSSGVVDWPFTMDAYDAKVRVILGENAYQRVVEHVENLQSEELFDQNWLEREFLIAFIHGISQYVQYKPYLPVFKAATYLPTPTFLKALHWIDRTIAQESAWNYAISNGKLSLTREEALTMKYTWHTWRFQQCNETGIFEASSEPEGIFNRTYDDFVAECTALFGDDQPRSAQVDPWSPRDNLDDLPVPMVYVAGELDPWEGLGVEQEYPLENGQYFFVPGGRHCQDAYVPKLGAQVMDALLQFAK
ncbi:MAG: hypothetical protein HN916_07975 [Anaerolineae bacterium]|nr:hypothetical protein [Anaerolineae bacterium]